MPIDPETHKEIVEMKKDIRELRHAQDAEIQHDREKYTKLLEDAINRSESTARALLAIDGFRSRKEIQDFTGLEQKTCWRKIDRLESREVIYDIEEPKKGSPVYKHSRWFTKLRLDDHVRNKYLQKGQGKLNVEQEQGTDQNKDL